MVLPRVSGSFDRTTAEPGELAFARSEYEARWVRAKSLMAEASIDLLYATSPAHMCWLHGYAAAWYRTHAPSNWGACLGTALALEWDEPIHFDALGEDALLFKTSVADDRRFFDDRSPEGQPLFIVDELRASGLLMPGTVVGLEHRSFQPCRWVQETIESAFRDAGCEVVDASMILRRARRLKSPAELAHITRAMEICALGHGGLAHHPARRDRARHTGRDGASNVRGGRGGLGHSAHDPIGRHDRRAPVAATAGREGRRVPEDRLFGVWFRYHGNILRGFWTGEPPQSVRDCYRRSAGSWDVFAHEARAGRPVREVNAELRRYYAECGLEGSPGWCIGYELGIAFAPDWVDEFNFSYDEDPPDEVVWEEGFVGNFETL